MDKNSFDETAANYTELLEENLGKYGKDISYYAEYKSLFMAQHVLGAPQQILEFGCGTGRNIPFIKKHFPQAEISAYDPSQESIEHAKSNNPNINFVDDIYDDKHNAKYDLILVAGVYHHIPVAERESTTQRLHTLLKPQGELFLFEHNPYNPLTQKAVSTCPFDEDAVLLPPAEAINWIANSGLQLQKLRYCLFFPASLKRLRFLERFLYAIPFGGQYAVHALKK